MAKAKYDIREAASVSSLGTAGKLTLTIIKPGLSLNKNYYSAKVLKESVDLFQKAQMFADHAEAGVASVNNWVATIGDAWVEKDGSLAATAQVICESFQKKLEKLKESHTLSKMGVSVRIVGTASEGEKDGETCRVVEEINEVISVDFVSRAAAGGRVETLESLSESDRSRQIEKKIQKDYTTARLIEAYAALGLSPQECLIAAGVENRIIDEQFKNLGVK